MLTKQCEKLRRLQAPTYDRRESNRMGADFELSELILSAVDVYNRYRSPEAKAKLLNLDNQGFTIEFGGTFCQSCGVPEYFEGNTLKSLVI